MKYVYVFNILAILIILLLVNCAGREKNHPAPMTNQTQYSMLLTDNEQLPDPLILDGKPFVGSGGKAYRKDEAYLIEFFGFNFDSDADRWYSLE
jgi:type IV pilus biogenesis protein CpaD/CtpE